MDRGTLGELRHLLRPLATRVANMVARGVVQLVNDAKKLQLLQLGVLDGEDVPDAEHHQPYGFSSVPLVGAEVIAAFPNGDREHPIALVVSDRRHRPTGGEAGQVTMHHYSGSKITMLANGDIEITATGKTIFHDANAVPGPASEGVVIGTGVDPFTGQTYNALMAVSTKVFVKK